MKRSRTFRVFISSTFGDLKAERDALQKFVFPKLRELCHEHGCRFQAIDLRWGVSEEAALDQQTMNICLEELRRCQKTTPRPNFVVLLGGRYGWCPLPPQIPAQAFDAILAHVADEDGRALLAAWYRRDDNAVPAEFCLQVREGDAADPERWSDTERRLHRILVGAAQRAGFSKAARLKYEASATHQEIDAGALHSEQPTRQVFCFFRSVRGLPHNARANDFRDIDEHGRPDRQSEQSLRQLKATLSRRLPDKVHTYVARWTGRGISTTHLERLCADVHERLSRAIRREMSRLAKAEPVEEEKTEHDAFGAARARAFTGRIRLLQRIGRYVAGADRRPLLLYGASGSGKSALVAKAVADCGVWRPESRSVVRFIGATPGSTDVRTLLESLCRQIAREYGRTEHVGADYKELIGVFAQRLAFATEERPLVVFLDALDQLSAADRAQNLMWLPTELPPHVRFIVSTLPGECLTILEKRVPRTNRIRVLPMAASEVKTLLGVWLREAGRTLQPAQLHYVLSTVRRSRLPLYLKLVFEEARCWKSYTPAPRPAPMIDAVGMVGRLFDRLSMDANHGRTLVSRSLGYLAAARNGLAEDELLDVLSLDPAVLADFKRRSPRSPGVGHLPFVVWSRLYADLEPYLTQRRGDNTSLIAFYHRQLGEVAAAYYLGGKDKLARHRALAAYFGKHGVSAGAHSHSSTRLRVLSELPYQQTHGRLWPALECSLTAIEFLEAKCQAGGTYDLIADYNAAAAAPGVPEAARRTINEFARFVKAQAHLLARRPALTLQQAANEPDTSGPGRAARRQLERRDGKRWIRWVDKPQTPSHCMMVLVGHIGEINACDISPDGTRLISTGLDRTVRLWDPSSGLEIMTLVGHDTPVASCAYAPDGSCIASADYRGYIKLWDPQTGVDLASLKAHPNQIELCAFSRDGKRLISAGNDNTMRIWDVPGRRQITVLSKHPITAMACAFSPDGRLIATGNQLGELTLWSGRSYKELTRIRAHQAEIKSCTFSPDGKWLLTCSQDGTFKRWNANLSGAPLTFVGHAADVWMCCVSPDHLWIASGAADHSTRLWDAHTGLQVGELTGHTEAVLSCAFMPDGDRLITSSWDGTIRLWDVSWLKRQRRRAAGGVLLQPDQSRVAASAAPADAQYWLSCAVSPDGTHLLAGSEDELRLWDLASGALRQTFGKHADYVRNCVFAHDGRHLFSTAEANVYLWDREKPEISRIHFTHGNLISDLHLSPDGERLLSSSEDGTLRLSHAATGRVDAVLLKVAPALTASAVAPDWSCAGVGDVEGRLRIVSIPAGEILAYLPAHRERIATVSFSPDSRLLVTGGMDSVAKVWDVVTRTVVAAIGHEAPVLFSAFSPDGRSLATSARDATLKIWDTGSFHLRKTLVGHATEFWTFAWTPDSSRILSSSYDGTLRLWNPVTGAELAMLSGFRNSVVAARVAPDGRRLVSASHFTRLEIRDAATGRKLIELGGHDAEIRDCAFSPDGRRIVSASADRTLRVWDAATGALQHVLRGHSGPVQACQFSPDGTQVVSGSWDRTVRLWDVASGRRTITLAGHSDWVQGAAFSPDGRRIVSCGLDRTLKIWDGKTGREQATLAGHQDGVSICRFSPDGRWLLSASGDATLRLWNVTTSREIRRCDGHTGPIRSCAFSPDGRWIASGGMDRSLRLWSTRQRGASLQLGVRESWVLCCAFSPDGRWLASAGNDAFVALWDVRTRRLNCEYWVGAPIRCLVWRPSGRTVIAGDEKGRVHVLEYEPADGERLPRSPKSPRLQAGDSHV